MKELTDFLSEHAPFDALPLDDLQRLADVLEVEHFPAGAVALAADADADSPDHLWIVRVGTMEVLDDDWVVDVLGPGDIFGYRALLSGSPTGREVRAAEEALCYRLPDPRTVVRQVDLLRRSVPGRRGVAPASATGPIAGAGSAVPDKAYRAIGRYARSVVWCSPELPVRDVAAELGRDGHSCALVRMPDGIGIVTDHDFRARVATGEISPDEPVARIVTVPARQVPADASVASALLMMVDHAVHHLVVTDGDGRPHGVIRAIDLASAEVSDPLVVRAAIEGATDLASLASACRMLPGTVIELFDAGVPPGRIAALYATVVEAAVRRLLAIESDVLAEAGVRCSWIALGSLARKEMLPSSDVDSALVWADPVWADPARPDGVPDTAGAPDSDGGGDPSPDPGDVGDVARRVHLAASRILDDLQRCGLPRCTHGTTPAEPAFARSLSDWQRAVAGWIKEPESEALLMATMLVDGRVLTEPDLGSAVLHRLSRAPLTRQFKESHLTYALAARPPTGFVRDFVVEHGREHRGRLDLKRGGLRPVASLGRFIALVTGDHQGDTVSRLRLGASAGLLDQDEADALIGAFEQVFRLVLEREVAALRVGRPVDTYLAPGDLDRLSRRHLRESFRAIAAVQHRLESGWMRLR